MSSAASKPGQSPTAQGQSLSSPPPHKAPEVNPSPKGPTGPGNPAKPRLYRQWDWVAFAITTFIAFAAYYYTLAPQVTLEDSGELAVGSFYAGVPHPPGYPIWTIYTWLFTVLFPF